MSNKYSDNQSFGYGAHDKLPHYGVIGKGTEFYVWRVTKKSEPYFHCCSEWIKGKEAFQMYNQLKELHGKDRQAFYKMVDEIMAKNPKTRW